MQMGLSAKREVWLSKSNQIQSQISSEGVAFDDFFSPVLKITTLRFLLGVVEAKHLELFQLEIKTTFFHGDVEEEIDMEQPKRHNWTHSSSHTSHSCHTHTPIFVSYSYVKRIRVWLKSIRCRGNPHGCLEVGQDHGVLNQGIKILRGGWVGYGLLKPWDCG